MRSLDQRQGGRTHTRVPEKQAAWWGLSCQQLGASALGLCSAGRGGGQDPGVQAGAGRAPRPEQRGRMQPPAPPPPAQLQAPLTAPLWLNSGGRGCSVLIDEHGPNRVRRGEGLPPRAGWAPSFPHCCSLAAPGEVQLRSSPGAPSPLGAAEGPGRQGHPRVLVPISWPLVTCWGVSARAGAAQTFRREDSSALDGSGPLH